jgi:hypothetical protein
MSFSVLCEWILEGWLLTSKKNARSPIRVPGAIRLNYFANTGGAGAASSAGLVHPCASRRNRLRRLTWAQRGLLGTAPAKFSPQFNPQKITAVH